MTAKTFQFAGFAPVRHVAQRRSRSCALALVVSTQALSNAYAGHDVFHIFTPLVEQGHWGVEALSTIQSGLPAAEHGADGHDGHGAPRAAHELAVHGGVTEFWMAKAAFSFSKEAGESYRATSVALENVFRMPGPMPAPGGVFDAAWFTSISAAIGDEATNAIEFGPVIALAVGDLNLTLNPFLEKTFGQNREDGIAFSYGWRAVYQLDHKISLGLEGYGEIENIGDSAAVRDQVHRAGPVIYLGHVHGMRPHHGDAAGAAHAGAAHEDHGVGGHADEPDWHGEFGVLFGLTGATADAAFKINIGADY